MSKRGKKAESPRARKKALPRFNGEDEQRSFWAAHDSVDYADWSKAKRVILPRLKLSARMRYAESGEPG